MGAHRQGKHHHEARGDQYARQVAPVRMRGASWHREGVYGKIADTVSSRPPKRAT